jgi:hypothetical protein
LQINDDRNFHIKWTSTKIISINPWRCDDDWDFPHHDVDNPSIIDVIYI